MSVNIKEFLLIDFKETNEHLRETDRKLASLMQVFSGAFAISITLAFSLPNKENSFLDFYQIKIALLIIVEMLAFFLYLYTLRCKITKKVYLIRCNFIRRELHKLYKNPQMDLPGYWTSTNRTQEIEEKISKIKNDNSSLKNSNLEKIGLDDLYPIGLVFIMVVIILIIPILIFFECNGLVPLNHFMNSAFIVTIILYFVICGCIKLMKNTNKLITGKEKYILISYD